MFGDNLEPPNLDGLPPPLNLGAGQIPNVGQAQGADQEQGVGNVQGGGPNPFAGQVVVNRPAAVNVASLVHLIGIFTGSENTIQVENWLEQVETVGQIGNWLPQNHCLAARLRIEGEARSYLDSAPEIKNENQWEIFKAALIARFKRVVPHAVALQRFNDVMQLPNEDVQTFASRLRAAGQLTLPAGPPELPNERAVRLKVLDENLVTNFRKGLRPGVRRYVLTKNLKTFAENVQDAVLEEENDRMTEKRVKQVYGIGTNMLPQSQSPATSNTSDYSMRAQAGSSSQNLIQRGENTQRQVVKCFRCEREGHYARDCNNRIVRMMQGNEPVCFYCKESGHIKSLCPQLPSHNSIAAQRNQFQSRNMQYQNAPQSKRPYNNVQLNTVLKCYECNSETHLRNKCPQLMRQGAQNANQNPKGVRSFPDRRGKEDWN
jgi:Zinc knuckle